MVLSAGMLVALVGALAVPVGMRADAEVAIPVAAAVPPVVTPEPPAPTALLRPARPDLPVRLEVPLRVSVAARVVDDAVRVVVAAPTAGRVQWTVRGPSGAVRHRETARVGRRPVTLTAAGLAPGRYRWQVAPVGAGPVRSGVLVVRRPEPAEVVVPPPPTEVEEPQPSATDRERTAPEPPKGDGGPRGGTGADPEDPADAIDPDDIPEPTDPNP